MSCAYSVQTLESNNELSIELLQQKLTSETQNFDYTVLPPQVQVTIQSKTLEIKNLMRRSAQDIVDIGQKLIEVKEQLGHGNFSNWLKAEFNWSVRTAARFMQVASQFKFVNFSDLNIAVSALYILAEPSTSKKARQQALELAKKGEYITHSKAKNIVNIYRNSVQSNNSSLENIDTFNKVQEGSSLTSFKSCKSMQNHSQERLADQCQSANLMVTELLDKTTNSIESNKTLEQNNVEKVNYLTQEKSELALEIEFEISNYIRILNIEHQNSELATNNTQTFDLTFAGTHVKLEGNPKILITLFEQIKNHPTFIKEILALLNQRR